MCHFITVIAPTDDTVAMAKVMERFGRTATPIDNAAVRKVLCVDEHQYLTARGQCDCGTVLATGRETSEALEARLSKDAARMKRKGWSETKIARAMEDQRKANANPDAGRIDSLELWSKALNDLRSELRLPYVGLLVRLYSGLVESEVFIASRREVSGAVSWQNALGSLEQDEVTIFR